MKKITKFNLRTLLVLVLSLALCFSTLLSVACDTPDSSSSSSSSTSTKDEKVYPTDTQAITNGDFEFSTFENKVSDYPDATSIGWSRTYDSIVVSADSSSKSSGIINTKAGDDYNTMAEKQAFPKVPGAEEGTEVYYNPGTPYDYGFVTESFDWVEPAEGETALTNDDALPMTGNKVLMIRNLTTNTQVKGTAQKFTSTSSLSLGRNEYAELSVWVKTYALASSYDVDHGAYVAVQNTVSTAAAPFIIKNINTNGNWAKYTIYLESSDFTTSSFKVVLGLGFGSKANTTEYVEGFAFFDNVTYKTISREDYLTATESLAETNLYENYELREDAVVANQKGQSYEPNTTEGDDADKSFTNVTYSLSHRKEKAVAGYTLLTDYSVENHDHGFNANGEVSVKAVSELGLEEAEQNPAVTGSVLYINHANPTSTSVSSKVLELASESYVQLTFWVKVHTQYPNDTGLTITVKDLGTGIEVEDSTATAIASNVKTDEYENEDYGNWCQYVIYLSNTADNNTRNFVITFDFGTTVETITNGEFELTQGYAIISEFSTYELTKEEYAIADVTKYTYAKKVSLSHDLPNGSANDSTDESYTFTYGSNDEYAVSNGNVATNVIGYTGVVGNSKFVGGSNDTLHSAEGVKAGVVNSEKYSLPASLGAEGENAFVQPLMINRVANAPTFGYVGSNAKIAAGTSALITVKVYVEGNATAYIYLASTDPLGLDIETGDTNKFKVLDVNATGDNESALNHSFVISVSAEDMKADYMENGWLTVRFLIVAGNEDISYRPEFWNGSRDGSTSAEGTVYFDSYAVSTVKSVRDLQEEIKADYNLEVEGVKFTRVPTAVKYTDDDGEEATRYIKYDEKEVLWIYNECKTQIIDLTTVYTVNEEDRTTTDSEDTEVEDSTSSESTAPETSFSAALQITSIIVASVLIAALIAVLVRMLVKKHRKNKGASASYYNRDSRERAGLAIEAKKARLAAKESDTVEGIEESIPYDYDNMENNIEQEVSEETSEEGEVEESSPETQDENAETTEEKTPVEGENNGENN